MKLVRYGNPGKEKPGLIDAQGKLRDLSAIVPDLGPAQLGSEMAGIVFIAIRPAKSNHRVHQVGKRALNVQIDPVAQVFQFVGGHGEPALDQPGPQLLAPSRQVIGPGAGIHVESALIIGPNALIR